MILGTKGQKSLRFLVIGRLQNRCSDALLCLFFVLPTSEILEPDKISRTKRGRTNRANVHTPTRKKSLKTQRGRIPIDPAILPAIGRRFIATKRKLKCRRLGLRRRPETNWRPFLA